MAQQTDDPLADSRREPLRSDDDDTRAPVASEMNGASLALSVFVALLFVALRLWRLTDSCLWFDEIFSLHAARHDWSAMFSFVAQDLIHPPLFYALLKLWTTLGGESLAWLRLFPALTSAATLLPLFLLCRALRLKRDETVLALLLMSVNGYLIKYAQEVRMYSLLLFFTCCSLWLFVRYYNARASLKRHAAALFVVNLLLVYTHYYGWLVVVSQFVFLLVYAARRKWATFIWTTIALLACYSPWAYAVVRAAATGAGLRQNIGWMARPDMRAVFQFYTTLNEILYYPQSNNEPLFSRRSVPLGLILFGSPVLLLLIRRALARRAESLTARQEPHALRVLLLFAALPLALAFVASWLLPLSVWGARHLIIIAAPYLILAAVALGRLRPLWIRNALLISLACWTLLSASLLAIRRDGLYIWCAWGELARQLPDAERARGAVAPDEAGEVEGETREIEAGEVEAVKVYAFEDLVAYHTWFALSRMRTVGFRVEVVKGVEGLAEDPAYFLPRGFHEVSTTDEARAFREERFWIAFRDTAWKPASQPLKMLRERGYETGEGFTLKAQGHTAFLVPVRRRRDD